MWMRVSNRDSLIDYDYGVCSLPADSIIRDTDGLVRGHWLQWVWSGGYVYS